MSELHSGIRRVTEARRGCGYRKVGGIYLVSDSDGVPCGRLPFPLNNCPCCGRGIKPARGWAWVNADELIRAAPPCPNESTGENNSPCLTCPMGILIGKGFGKAGLIWVGSRYYPSPEAFNRESVSMGISRRIRAVPNGFQLGKTWVLLGHRQAIVNYAALGDSQTQPGIFRIFRPQRVEIIITEDTPAEKIDGYINRGLTPVIVDRLVPDPPLNDTTIRA